MNELVINPCAADIDIACTQFDAEEQVLEEALGELFSQYPKNTKVAHVFLKVTALNALYGTQIPVFSSRIPILLEVAHHIVSIDIDSGLDHNSDDVVGRIAKISVAGKADRYNYSFATKYCSWHKPDSYPIFDSRVNEYLWHLRQQHCLRPFHRDTLWEYPQFKRIVTDFRDTFGLGNYTFKQIDKFLYFQGGFLFDQKNEIAVTAARA